jgi:hypothetical protein
MHVSHVGIINISILEFKTQWNIKWHVIQSIWYFILSLSSALQLFVYTYVIRSITPYRVTYRI